MNSLQQTINRLREVARSRRHLFDLQIGFGGSTLDAPQIEHVSPLPSIDAALDFVQTAIPTLSNLDMARLVFRLGNIVDHANAEYYRRNPNAAPAPVEQRFDA